MSIPPILYLTQEFMEKSATHKSYQQAIGIRVVHDNERLAFVGQGVISASLANTLYVSLQDKNGKALKVAKTKFLPIQKNLLAYWATEYGLEKNIRCLPSSRAALEASIDFRASIMEAYIGALSLEQGIDKTSSWLYQLFAHAHIVPPLPQDLTLAEAMKMAISSEIESIPGCDGTMKATIPDEGIYTNNWTPTASSPPTSPIKGPVAKLNEKAAKASKVPEWVFGSVGQGETIRWTAKVIVDKELVGQGDARSKQSAKTAAANEALTALHWE